MLFCVLILYDPLYFWLLVFFLPLFYFLKPSLHLIFLLFFLLVMTDALPNLLQITQAKSADEAILSVPACAPTYLLDTVVV